MKIMVQTIVFLAISLPAFAATITFHSESVTCQGTAVTLGDIATVMADRDDDAAGVASLKSTVLFPAPVAGKDRTITYKEVYDMLNMRGVRVGQHTFQGASTVTIIAEQQTSPKQSATTSLENNTQTFIKRSTTNNEEEAVRHAVLTFLKDNVDASASWQVDVTISAEGQRRLAAAGAIIGIQAVLEENESRSISSQHDPAEQWLGRQRFLLQCNSINPETGMHRTLTVEVNVSLPQAVVVARHAIAKGKILSTADVKLSYIAEDQMPALVTKSRTVGGITTQRGREAEISPDVATRIDDVIGKVTTVALRKDAPVQFSQLEKPLLVKRSEAVTLFMQNGGITIKMTTRAKEDGREGDMIAVETLTDRQDKQGKPQTLLARVVDYGTVVVER